MEDNQTGSEYEQALWRSEVDLRALFAAVSDMMVVYDRDGYCLSFMSINPKLLYQPVEMQIGKRIDQVFPLELAQRFLQCLQQALDLQTTIALEYSLLIDGKETWLAAKVLPTQAGNLLWVARDITERKLYEETISHQASHDLLTDIPNRNLFNQNLTAALDLAKQIQGNLAVMFLDLDRFKTINDSLGHSIGDRLLQSVVKRLVACLDTEQSIARWGGDEFTLFLPQIRSAEDATDTAQKILDALEPAFNLDGYALHTTCSIGIALYPSDGEDGNVLIKNADAALSHAKKQGRNNYQLYAKTMNSQAPNLLELETNLHKALASGEFVVYYQPKVDINTWQIKGMEALVRWQHPKLGMISPQIFIPLAEDSGLIVPLAEWVLRTACTQNKVWFDAGLTHLRMAVNLSARQFLQASLVKMVTEVLADTGLEPHLLELEITESLAMQDMDCTRTILQELYNMGVRIAIDDFGTGYSSLSYLRNFPLDCIKVDRTFVRDLTIDPYAKAIMTAVIALGHGLSLDVVVEGVETKEQLEYLRSLQCDEIQGHLFSPPIPAAEATRLLWRQSLGANLKTELSA